MCWGAAIDGRCYGNGRATSPPQDGRRCAGAAGAPLMTLERIAWSLVIVAGLVAAALFVSSGRNGYGLLSALLALAASVNLWSGPGEDE